MDFEGNLKKGGLKITPQRITILKEIQKAGHATVDEIYERILEIYPSISLATIYKNLTSMCEAGILNEIKPPLQKQRYELNHTPHSHLICQICGSLQDIDLDFQSLGLEGVCRDFEVTNISIALYGICKECKNA
ncbi:Fur family transcriptional regulator [Helicobacter brantae]|uniref:Transcriptional repressor n=1 Tax=Helicobacter brantae TaxID=375927 RepID=A0A3D8J315_9HELI|nr:transcriptional repressor [Helicobacter brantae]RDU71869.1 transcriptional repressor [Helicobacter brantae]